MPIIRLARRERRVVQLASSDGSGRVRLVAIWTYRRSMSTPEAK